MINYVIRGTQFEHSAFSSASNNYSGMVDWPSYNESLVRRGQMTLGF